MGFSHVIEQPFHFHNGTDIELCIKRDVSLNDAVNHIDEAEVIAFAAGKRVVALSQIVAEGSQGIIQTFGVHLVLHDVVQGMDWDLDTFFHGEVFTKRHTMQSECQYAARQVAGSVVDVQYRRTCEDRLQLRNGVVDVLQFLRPVGVFVDFVDEKVLATQLVELPRQVEQAMVGEIEVVCRHIQCFLYGEMQFDVLEQHRGLAHAATAHDGNHSVVPRDAIMQVAQETRIGLFEQIMVSKQ